MKKHYQKPRVRTLRMNVEASLLAASGSESKEQQSNFTIEQWDDPEETDVDM